MPRLRLGARLRAAVRAALAPQPVLQPRQHVAAGAVAQPQRWRLAPLVQRWDEETEMFVPVGPWTRLVRDNAFLPENRDDQFTK